MQDFKCDYCIILVSQISLIRWKLFIQQANIYIYNLVIDVRENPQMKQKLACILDCFPTNYEVFHVSVCVFWWTDWLIGTS